MGGPEMAPHTPHPLVAPRRSRGAPRPPTARRAPATPWRASPPTRSSRPGEAVARLDPHPLVAPRRSRGAPRYSGRLLSDPDGLDVDELADAVLRELASVARALDPAEGQARGRLH